MSFDSKKNVYGEKLSSGVSIFVNACKYTVDGALDKRHVTIPTISNIYVGALTISGGDPLFFQTSNPYLKIDDEYIKITVDSDTQITITERGKFGTTPAPHNGEAMIVHGGEADGSCLGYPSRPDGGGCSTADSFERTAEREFLFIDGQSFDGQIYYNGLESLSHSAVLTYPGVSMAKNATYSISVSDNTDDDVYAVPYPDRRTSNATLFKKLLARTGGYLQNRRAIVYTGFEENGNFSKNNCVAREYIIDSVSLDKGVFNVSCLDPLMLTEESKAKIPATSSGKLLNALDDTSTTIELTDFIDGEYGSNGSNVVIVVDSELIDCTVVNSATGELSINSRALGNSEQKTHSANATVQKVIVLTNYNPVETIISWLQEYTNIPAKFYGDYSFAIANTQPATGPVYIYKPDSLSGYIDEIIETWAEANITMYFCEREQLIKIKTVGDFEQQPLTLSYETDIKQDSLTIEPQYSTQVTRASVGFAPYNAAEKTDEENASITYESINALTELTGTLEPQEDEIFYTQFLSNFDEDIQIAVSGVARKSNLNVKVPESFTFDIDYSKYGEIEEGLIEEGEIINVTTDRVVDDYGNPRASNLQILSLKDNPKKATYTIKAITYQDIISDSGFDFIIDTDKEDYDLSTEFAPSTPGNYTVFVKSGVTIGATTPYGFAFTTGAQSSGVTFTLIFRCSILGAGGNGAIGVDAIAFPGEFIDEEELGLQGEQGGDALNLTVPCTIDVSQGLVFAGGGGAPSTKSIANGGRGFKAPGNGGSGGQGYIGGVGGRAGTANIVGETATDGQVGANGTRAAPGSVGGVSAGAFGESSDENTQPNTSSLPGYAIRANGNEISIIGDNNLTIKGLRDF